MVDGARPGMSRRSGPAPSLERLITAAGSRVRCVRIAVTPRELASRSRGSHLIASFPLGLVEGLIRGQQETSGVEPDFVGRRHTHAQRALPLNSAIGAAVRHPDGSMQALGTAADKLG